MSTPGDLPLSGLSVVSVEQAVAAPFCTSRLADAGARVIKIERPGGDFARFYDDAAKGESSYFVWLNRGKESLVLNLKSKSGQAELKQLILNADILVQNLRPTVLGAIGIDLDELRALNPKLICCSITGYGDTGPLASRKAYDMLIQAEAGLASLTGTPESPARVGISVVDIATGATAHSAILEALIARGRSGKGADIRISMFDVMADWLTVPLLHHESGNTPKRLGLTHPSIAPYGTFTTKDGRSILLSVQSDREWAMLCAGLLRDASFVSDERFATNLDRVHNRTATDQLVAQAIGRLSRDEAVAVLDRSNIAFAEVNDMAGLAAHPHLRRMTVGLPVGEVSLPCPAPIFVGEERSYGPVPEIGANRLEGELAAHGNIAP